MSVSSINIRKAVREYRCWVEEEREKNEKMCERGEKERAGSEES